MIRYCSISGPLVVWVLISSQAFAQDSHNATSCEASASDCQHPPRVFIEEPIGDVRVGRGQTLVGEDRFADRSMERGILIVVFSEAPRSLIGLSNGVPPPLDALIGSAEMQEAYDEQAGPGQFVTPPSIAM